ncbi:SGNH/GDSL hydrolase family protein [Sphingobacterium multivorum]|uniref:SGNH/GDSL hydrolase family protein n=1 Tax=Sphingobacterium multivorum TaxID=28454 RepID=UPI0031BAAD10
MAEDLDLEGKVLDARVRQKKDTLAKWEANELILLDGEQAFVVDDGGQPINFKIGDGTKKFADLPFWIAYDQGQYVAITGTVLPTPTATVGYSIVPEGTYTRAGQANVVVPAGKMGVLNFAANTWSLGSSVPLPVAVADGVVESGNTKATSGNAVFIAVEPIKDKFVDDSTLILIQDFGGFYQWAFNTSTFSGFGNTYGVVKNFSKIRIYHQARDTNATILKVRICETDVNGAVLFEGQVSISIPNGQTNYIDVDLGTVIKNTSGKVIWVEYYANGNMSLPRSNTAMTTPRKILYKTNGAIDTNFAQSSVPSTSNETRETFLTFYGVSGELVAGTELSNEVLGKGAAVGLVTQTETKAVAGKEVYPIKTGLGDITKDSFVPTSYDVRGGLDVIYATGAPFCSWGHLVGLVPDLGQVGFMIRPYDSANMPTYARFIIRDGGPSGAIMFDKTITQSFTVNTNTKVLVLVPGIDLTKNLFMQVTADGYIALLGANQASDQDAAHVVMYSTTKGSITLTASASNKKAVMYFELGKGAFKKSLSDSAVQQVKDAIDGTFPDPILLLTQENYVYPGAEKNAFNRNILVTAYGDSDENYVIDWNGPDVGSQFNRGFRTTGAKAGNLDYNISIVVRKGRQTLLTGTQRILSSATNKGNGITRGLNVIGDSLVAPGKLTQFILDNFASDGFKVRLEGTVGSGTNKHDGRAGRTIDWYYGNNNIPYYKIFVNGITIVPSLNSVYSQGSSTYKVEEVNFDSSTGDGYFSLSIVTGVAPTATGTLVLVSGGGQTPINYTTMTVDSSNPWRNPATGEFDYGYGVTNNGLTMTAGDTVPFQLGINDMFGITDLSAAQLKANTMATQLTEMIASVHAYNPGINAVVAVTVFPSTQDGFGANYNLGQTREMYVKTGLVTWQKKVLDTFDNATMRSNNIYVVPIHANLDTLYNFPYVMQKPNARYTGTELVKYQTNGVHPNDDGTKQIADDYCGFLKWKA